jgi:hypothetical protein
MQLASIGLKLAQIAEPSVTLKVVVHNLITQPLRYTPPPKLRINDTGKPLDRQQPPPDASQGSPHP